MSNSYVFLADGFEEVEALSVVDILRRGGMKVYTVSINDTTTVTGANGIVVKADCLYTDVRDFNDAEWLICPGGMPGSGNLAAFAPLCSLLKAHAADGGKIAAICAAPALVLAPLGLLKGKNATCYPGMEGPAKEAGADMTDSSVVVDDNIVTGQGPAAAMTFALTILEEARGEEVAIQIGKGLLYYE